MNESSPEPPEKKEGIITQRVKALDERLAKVEGLLLNFPPANGPAVDLSPLEARVRDLEHKLFDIVPFEERLMAVERHPVLSAPQVFRGEAKQKCHLLVVLSYHSGDTAQTKTLLEWIFELSPLATGMAIWETQILLVADSAVPRETIGEIHQLAKKVFARARTIIATLSKKGWPSGCDAAFLWACRYIKDHYKLPFLWLEPDCVPLKENWLTELSDAYESSAYRFMGAVIEQTGQKDMPARFLAGCAVYPNHAFDIYNALPSVVNGTAAWDIAGGVNIAEGSENTKLIQHFWGSASDKPPIFVKQKSPDSPENHVMLDFLSQDAVLFHRSKDGKLIDLLREQRNGGTVDQSSQPAPVPAEHLD